ncbi:MAG: nucleotidyltransferase domain-containing protein [Bacteroidota bacterium]|nr:nucleotidyltransferase domain-containing protein [Bacteroidota bacterium]
MYFSTMNNRPLTKKIIYAELQKNKAVLEQYGVKQIGLFGSFVRNEGTEESDIDFLVDFEKEKKRLTILWTLLFFWKSFFSGK